jgi:Ca2+-binding RTX toxin-like protein
VHFTSKRNPGHASRRCHVFGDDKLFGSEIGSLHGERYERYRRAGNDSSLAKTVMTSFKAQRQRLLTGGDGNDFIQGADGNDVFRRGGRRQPTGFWPDYLIGGIGADQLFGGSGDDP